MPPSKTMMVPQYDPYEILGVPFGATDAEITKAYRKLALKLHPDKQQQSAHAAPAQAEQIAKQFHDVKEARSFLLDVEHAEDRRLYDAKRESDRLRQETEALREKTMSERRKQMRNELKAKEEKAAASVVARQRKQQQQDATGRKASATINKHHQSRFDENDDDFVEHLRREGKRKRTEFMERDAVAQQEQELQHELKRRQEKKDRQLALEQRQVRLKWDRKKIRPSPSEDSLAKLLSHQFGTVEHVELLGKKGNQALVTFTDPSSCQLCVDLYSSSNEMRAKFVGKRKKEEEEEPLEQQEEPNRHHLQRHMSESLESRRLRLGEERERLLREMEAEDENNSGKTSERQTGGKDASFSKNVTSKRKSNFPLCLPEGEKYQGLSSLEILEAFEDDIMTNILSTDKLQSIKVPVSVKGRQ